MTSLEEKNTYIYQCQDPPSQEYHLQICEQQTEQTLSIMGKKTVSDGIHNLPQKLTVQPPH